MSIINQESIVPYKLKVNTISKGPLCVCHDFNLKWGLHPYLIQYKILTKIVLFAASKREKHRKTQTVMANNTIIISYQYLIHKFHHLCCIWYQMNSD